MSGVGGIVTAMDCLIADVISLVRTVGLGFPAALCDSETMFSLSLACCRRLMATHDTLASTVA